MNRKNLTGSMTKLNWETVKEISRIINNITWREV